MIGVLIETNDRIIGALEHYDLVCVSNNRASSGVTHFVMQLLKPDTTEQQVKEIQEGLAAAKLSTTELGKLQDRQRAAIERSIGRSGSTNYGYTSPGSGETSPTSPTYVHPDLQDLQFGALGSDQKYVSRHLHFVNSNSLGIFQSRGLPPPMRPTGVRRSSSDEDETWRRGSLSDFSDYQSSDEETHNRAGPSNAAQSRRRGYVDVSDNESSQDVRRDPKQGLLQEEDPFADPFAD